MGCVEEMNERQWDWWDLLIAVLLALIVLAEVQLAIKIGQVDAETERVEALMVEAQERIDAYQATLSAKERPVVSEAPVVTARAPEKPETPEWYIAYVPMDKPLQKALWDACAEFEIDYTLALAVIEQETNYQNQCGDSGDSIGFFQIQPRWWGELMERIGTDDLADPVDNFRTGCAVLRELLLCYDGSVTDALTAYNSGHPGRSVYAEAVLERKARFT